MALYTCYIRRKILVLVGVFTSLGQVTGLCTPWWVVLVSSDTRLVYGLWYTLTCDVSSGLSVCKSLSSFEDSIIGRSRLEYQLETLFGAILSILAVVFLLLYNPREETIRTVLTGLLTIVLNLTSVLLTWIAVGRVCSENVILRSTHDMDIPWSLIVSAVFGTVPLFVAAFLACRVYTNFKSIQKENEQKKKTKEFYEQRSCHSSMDMLNNTIHSSMPSLDLSFSNKLEAISLDSLDVKEYSPRTYNANPSTDTSPGYSTDSLPYKYCNDPP